MKNRNHESIYLVLSKKIYSIIFTILAISGLFIISQDHVSAISSDSVDNSQLALDSGAAIVNSIFLPSVLRNYPPLPVPQISPISNLDQDNFYTVSWQSTEPDVIYLLEQATNPSFSNTQQVYKGFDLNWTVPGNGKLPGTYYYRVKATKKYNESDWSNTKSIRIFPLFVGLKIRWDGNGYIRGYESFDVGSHYERFYDMLTEPDTIRSNNHFWY